MPEILPDMTAQLILNFHGVGEPHSGVEAEERQFWISQLELRKIFERVTLLQSGAIKLGQPLPEILLTFDDGNLSDHSIALPELVRAKLKATFLVCMGRVGTPYYLDKAHIRELQSAEMIIGNHGMHQRNLVTLSQTELAVEVSQASDGLSEITGKAVDELAIPYGSYNRRVLTWLQAQPIKTIYTSDRGLTSSEIRIKSRESITEGMAKEAIPDMLMQDRPLSSKLRRWFSGKYKRWR